MSGKLERIRSQALRLSDVERAALARDLVKSLDPPGNPDLPDAWDRELLRRLAEIDAGTAKFIDRGELRRRMRARLNAG